MTPFPALRWRLALVAALGFPLFLIGILFAQPGFPGGGMPRPPGSGMPRGPFGPGGFGPGGFGPFGPGGAGPGIPGGNGPTISRSYTCPKCGFSWTTTSALRDAEPG